MTDLSFYDVALADYLSDKALLSKYQLAKLRILGDSGIDISRFNDLVVQSEKGHKEIIRKNREKLVDLASQKAKSDDIAEKAADRLTMLREVQLPLGRIDTSGNIMFFNPALGDLIDKGYLIGKSIGDLIQVEGIDSLVSEYMAYMNNSPQPCVMRDPVPFQKDGRMMYLEISLMPLPDGTAVFTATDVTLRKLARDNETAALNQAKESKQIAERAARELAVANSKLEQALSDSEERAAEIRTQLEQKEGYKLQKERQDNQFSFARMAAPYIYVLVLALLFAYIWLGGDQTLGAILASAIGILIGGGGTMISSMFSVKEKEEIQAR